MCIICTYGLSCHPSGRVQLTTHWLESWGGVAHWKISISPEKTLSRLVQALLEPFRLWPYTHPKRGQVHFSPRTEGVMSLPAPSTWVQEWSLRGRWQAKARSHFSGEAGAGLSFLYMHHLVILFQYLKTNKHLSLQQTTQEPQYWNSQRKCDSQESCDFQYNYFNVTILSLQIYSFSGTCFSTPHFLVLPKEIRWHLAGKMQVTPASSLRGRNTQHRPRGMGVQNTSQELP